jgi:hypothetical protein
LISLFDGEFGGFKRSGDDKVFTKTMINNYTKLGLLMPPENKKYTREPHDPAGSTV